MTLTFKKAQWVKYQGREGQVVRIPNLHEVQLRDRNGDLFTARISDLITLDTDRSGRDTRGRPVDSDSAVTARMEAEFRLEVISPLLALGPARTRADVRARAEDRNCGVTTIYRWMQQYEAAGDLTGLLREVRSDHGKRRMPEGVEVMMESLIDRVYLTDQRPSMTSVYTTLLTDIGHANKNRAEGEAVLPVPDFQTFRRRIYGVEERRRLSRRFGERMASTLDPVLAHYPGANYPLAVVQVDHTPLDIILVDSVHRKPLGKAWLTLVIEVFSRVVLGFYISLDSPSGFSVGQALSHAILPKDLWLARHQDSLLSIVKELDPDIEELTWPCWGKPVKLKVDNAREFWGNMLKVACAEYNIDQEFRPVRNPKYGGHIERLIGTTVRQVHTLSGTTFSNPQVRGEYDSEGRAMMTMEALQLWVTAFYLGAYHNRVHSALGVTPLQMWERGLLEGTELHPPTGLPERIMGDRAERLRLNFLPFFEATVQPGGVQHEGLSYMGAVLHRYIKAKDPERPGSARKFVFRYDPRDISQIYFLDPELNRYYEIRCRQPNFPSISIWELKAAKKFAKAQRLRADDDRSILSAYRMMTMISEAEQDKTREARRTEEKRRHRDQAPKLGGVIPVQKPSGTRSALNLFQDDEEVLPFDDIQV
ncbi:transposase [Deinococcus radiomollis]|uniref:Mu transposase C-terminal domain-containing protein n=1 Tax=Deinococcus radiomollis TaxID=468916 RepID=UPI00389159BC